MKNIYLIGMMGSWKSTIGIKLANNLNMNFIDTDDCIEETTNMKIKDIFSEFGENYFRDIENKIFLKYSKKKNYVVSTGGGIVLNRNNRIILKQDGITVLLEASMDVLARRIKKTNKRPLLINSENKLFILEKIWNERKKYYYESTKFIINTDKLDPVITLNNIIKLIKK